jgi:hypothetical protein
MSAGVLAIAAALTLGGTQLVRLFPDSGEIADHEDGRFVPAEPGENTYILDVVEIEYPFMRSTDNVGSTRCMGHERRRCEPDPGSAGVFVKYRWATDSYPGEVRCRVHALDDEGNVIGTQMTGIDSLSPHPPRSFEIEVHVPERPADAIGECEKGVYKPGPGYRFRLLSTERYIVRNPGTGKIDHRKTKLTFDVQFVGDGEHVDARECRLIVTMTGGERRKFGPFTLSIGEDRHLELFPPIENPDTIESAHVKCWTLRP